VGFSEADETHRTTWYNRGRLGFDYQPSPESNIRVTYQYASINNKDEDADGLNVPPGFNPTGEWEDHTRKDVVEAYISRTWGMSEMVFGRQQVDRDWLVGSNNWGEVPRVDRSQGQQRRLGLLRRSSRPRHGQHRRLRQRSAPGVRGL
jgi:hypothetical protein